MQAVNTRYQFGSQKFKNVCEELREAMDDNHTLLFVKSDQQFNELNNQFKTYMRTSKEMIEFLFIVLF